MASTSLSSLTRSEQADPFVRRIELWRREVATATAQHPAPALPAPQGKWKRFQEHLSKKMRVAKEKMGVVKEELPPEEAPEQTQMYDLTEREREREREKEIERREQARARRTDEWSWNVEGEGRTVSTEEVESSGEQGIEKRRVDERQARLERAAELLLRQRQMELKDEEEVIEEAQLLV